MLHLPPAVGLVAVLLPAAMQVSGPREVPLSCSRLWESALIQASSSWFGFGGAASSAAPAAAAGGAAAGGWFGGLFGGGDDGTLNLVA